MKFFKSTILTALLALIGSTVYAGCTASAYFVQNGDTVTFYNDSSSSVSGNHTLTWYFGDGNTATGDQAVHQYAPGTYSACLIIYDSASNCMDSTCLTITVSNMNGGGNNCSASFSYGVDSSNYLKYYFYGSAPVASGSASWQLNDNGIKNYSGQNATHTFSANGTYIVTYILKDSSSNVCDTASSIIIINNNIPSCSASYYVALDSNNKFGLYLVNTSSGTNINTKYLWDFGDGTTSNVQYPTHQYTSFGLYTVCLTILDSNSNCYSTYCDSIGLDSNGNILKATGFGITVIDEAMLKIEEQTNLFSGVNVYPNPSNGMFKFIIDSKKGSKMTMRVTNRMGQQVAQNETYLTTGSNKAQLDLSTLSDGLYFVNLRAGDEVKSVKIYLAR